MCRSAATDRAEDVAVADQGADFADLAARFRRRPEFLEQVEQLARYKLGR